MQAINLPKETNYKDPIEKLTEETVRDRQIKNSQLRPQWEMKIQKNYRGWRSMW